MILNETPVRTSRSFNINNIKMENVVLPEEIKDFKNIEIINESAKNYIEEKCGNTQLTYGLCENLTNQVNRNSNKNLKLAINTKTEKEIKLYFKLDKDNINLIENIEIIANESAKATIILKYESENDLKNYHNGILRINSKKRSTNKCNNYKFIKYFFRQFYGY